MTMKPQMKATMAGKTHTVRHAFSVLPPYAEVNAGKRTEPIITCVKAPPRLPHPPTIPLAVPAVSLVYMHVGQCCAMTKVDPAMPMNSLITASPAAELTSPTMAVGIDATMRTTPIGMRDPYRSHSGPMKKRIKIVVRSEQIEDVQTCSLVMPRVF